MFKRYGQGCYQEIKLKFDLQNSPPQSLFAVISNSAIFTVELKSSFFILFHFSLLHLRNIDATKRFFLADLKYVFCLTQHNNVTLVNADR